MITRVSLNKYKGSCEVCGELAVFYATNTTALLQSLADKRLSAASTGLVRCVSGEHEYYVIRLDQQVLDPFEEDEALNTEPLDIELPPPPPRSDKEDS